MFSGRAGHLILDNQLVCSSLGKTIPSTQHFLLACGSCVGLRLCLLLILKVSFLLTKVYDSETELMCIDVISTGYEK